MASFESIRDKRVVGSSAVHLLSMAVLMFGFCPIGDGRRLMDKEMGWFHACSAYPVSDLTIRIPIL